MTVHVNFLSFKNLSPQLKAVLALLGDLSCSPWKFDVLWELWPSLGTAPGDFSHIAQEILNVGSEEEFRFAACAFDDLTIFWDVVGRHGPPYPHVREAYRFAYLSLRPMVFRLELDASPMLLPTSEEQYHLRLLLLVSMLGDTEWTDVAAVLRDCAARYEERGHVAGVRLATQNAEVLEQLAALQVPQRGPGGFAQGALQLMFSAEHREVAYEIALQWWPLYGDGFWDGLRVTGSGPLPGEDAGDSRMRREMRVVFEHLAPFAWLAEQRPGLEASVIGLAILRAEGDAVPPSLSLFPSEWIGRCEETLAWLQRQFAASADLPEREVQGLMARLNSLHSAADLRVPRDDTSGTRSDTGLPRSRPVPPAEQPGASNGFASASPRGAAPERDSDEVAAQVFRLNQQGMEHNWRGEFDQAMRLGTQARDLAQAYLGEQDPNYASSLNTLATAFEGMEDFVAAHALFEESVAVFKQALGENDPSYASSLNNLANVEFALGHLEVAESLFHDTLEIGRRVYGDQRLYLVPTMGNLARLHLERGETEGAEALLREGLEIRRVALGTQHPDYAGSLHHLAEFLVETGRLLEAVEFFREVLTIRAETLGDDHPDTIISLEEVALLETRLARYDDAEQAYRRLLHVRTQTVGERHSLYLQALTGLAGVCISKGIYHEATVLMRQASALHVTLHGEQDPGLAEQLRLQGKLYLLTGKYRQAGDVLQRALQFDEGSGDESLDVVSDLLNLGELHRISGDFAGAEHYILRANSILAKSPDASGSRVAAALNNQAELYRVMGKHSQAEPIYRRAIELMASEMDEDHPDYAAVVNNLALLHIAQGDYRSAIPLFEQAVRIYRAALPKHPTYAAVLSNLGMLHVTLGDYAEAESLLKEALAIRRRVLGEGHVDVAHGLDQLGSLNSARGRFDLAEPFTRQALESLRTSLGSGHPEVAKSIHNMAVHYLNSGYAGLAARFLADMEPVLQEALAQDAPHPQWAHTLDLWATFFSSVGNITAAEPLVRQAIELQVASLGDDHPVLVGTLRHLSRICASNGRMDEAMSLMWQASAITDGIVEQVFATTWEAQRLAFVDTILGDVDFALSLSTWNRNPSRTEIAACVDLVLKRKAISAEALAIQRDTIFVGRNPGLMNSLRDLNMLRSQIAQKMLSGPGVDDVTEHRRVLAAWQQRRNEIESSLARAIPEMALDRHGRGADHSSVATALPAGWALVEFLRFSATDFGTPGGTQDRSPRYVAFVMVGTRPEHPEMIDLGDAEVIDDLVTRFRDSVAVSPDSRAATNSDDGVVLRRMIFDSLVLFFDDCSQVLLAPDGDLNRLSFESLPAADGRLVIDDFRLCYVDCGRDVLRFESTHRGEPGPPLVVADPAFNLTADSLEDGDVRVAAAPTAAPAERLSRDLHRSMRFWRLKGTREEGERIAEMLGVRPLLGESAQEGRIKRARSPRVLHIATHGYFIENQPRPDYDGSAAVPTVGGDEPDGWGRLAGPHLENPFLRSGLAFAGANIWLRGGKIPPDAEDGLLTAEDITGMDLLDTELVVLSACETGLGDIRTGEGVFGLRRAVTLAGARSLVMSLWKVPDDQTRALMVDFYQHILRGSGVAEALRDAQLELRKRYADPYYWAAFVCLGDLGPISMIGFERQSMLESDQERLPERTDGSTAFPPWG